MRKIFLVFFIALVFCFAFTSPAQALLEGFNSGCLDDPGWTPAHIANLTIQKGKDDGTPAPGVDTWIFVCITKGTDSYCTTAGDGSLDTDLFGNTTHYNILKDLAKAGSGYIGGVMRGTEFTGQIPPKKTKDDDPFQFNEAVIWGDAYYPGVTHQWSWVQKAIDTGGAGEGGSTGALQQGTTPFDRLSKSTKKCAKIGWDPRGVIFDVNTFYPAKNIPIELYRKNEATGVYELAPNQLGLANPTTTSTVNGQYNFFVEAGWYKLKLINGVSIAKLTPSQLTTAKQFFTDTAGQDHIYVEDTPIREENGTVAIANVPVNITDTNLLVKELSVIDNATPTAEDGEINLFGRVSHPKSKMIITMNMLNAEGVVKQFVKTDVTDGLGEYDKLISQTVDSEESLVFQNATLSFELNSFYSTGVFSKKEATTNIAMRFLREIWDSILRKLEANAITTPKNTIIIKPIPSYIEGIAYDLKGKAISRAIVGVYPFFSEKPMYVTVADEDGRYKIGSQHLPKFEYKLRYKKPTGEVIVVDTSTFIKQNAKLLIEEDIKPFEKKQTTLAEDKRVRDFFSNTDTKLNIPTPAGGQSNNSGNKNMSGNSSQKDRAATTAQTNGNTIGAAGMQGIVMIIVVIMILIMIGVGAFIMMKSKQQSSPQY